MKCCTDNLLFSVGAKINKWRWRCLEQCAKCRQGHFLKAARRLTTSKRRCKTFSPKQTKPLPAKWKLTDWHILQIMRWYPSAFRYPARILKWKEIILHNYSYLSGVLIGMNCLFRASSPERGRIRESKLWTLAWQVHRKPRRDKRQFVLRIKHQISEIKNNKNYWKKMKHQTSFQEPVSLKWQSHLDPINFLFMPSGYGVEAVLVS